MLPAIELPADTPSIRVERQDPLRWLEDWQAPAEHWEQQMVAAEESAGGSLEARVAQRAWYHTIALPDGVVTPGLFDHRTLVPHYGLPADLSGVRALDVATFDGFWAFELERRGANVTAVDLPSVSELDWPAGMREAFVAKGLDRDPSDGFHLAAEALGSRVELVKSSIYELAPEALGRFELIHVGDVLLHLRDPVKALQQVRSVAADGAHVHVVDAFDPRLAGQHVAAYEGGWNFCTWWIPSLDLLAQMVLDAGFRDVAVHRTFRANTGDVAGRWRAVLVARA